MRIEISAGGIGNGISVLDFQSDMQDYLTDADGVIASFKAVESATYDLSGGVGSLQGALAGVQARRMAEEERRAGAVAVERKAEDFLDLATRVDAQVSALVDRNRDGFYRVYPWLRPAASSDAETPWYETAWNWLCDMGENIADGVERAWTWLGETAGKAWTAAMAFYEEHKKIIDTVLIVVGAIAAIAAVVASGGLALVPLLGALGLTTTAAVAISTAVAVVAVVSTVGAGVLNLVDTWCEVDDPTFHAWQKGLNITSVVTNLVYAVGGIYNSIKGVTAQEYLAGKQSYTNVNQLSGRQVDALNRYTIDEYRNINDSLRGLDSATPKNAETIQTMQNVLEHSSLPQDMTLYRGGTTNALGELKGLSPDQLIGKTFTESGFMSTTANPAVSNAFAGDMHITIEAARGAHALNIAPISNFPSEAEFLFSSGQQMLITSAEKIKGVLHITVLLQ